MMFLIQLFINFNTYVMFSSIPNIFLSKKDSGIFPHKKWAVEIKELKNYVKNALHFSAMNYCHV